MAENKKKSVATQPKTLGQKAVEWFPSYHKDPVRKKEQERGLQELVDLLIPQTKEDIAIDLALAFVPFGKIGKGVLKKFGDHALDNVKEGQKWLTDWLDARTSLPQFSHKDAISSEKLDLRDLTLTKRTGHDVVTGRREQIRKGDVPTMYDPDLESNVLAQAYGGIVSLSDKVVGQSSAEGMAKFAGKSVKDWHKGLGVHEYTHHLTSGDIYLSKNVKDYIYKMQQKSWSKNPYNKPPSRVLEFETQQWKDATLEGINYMAKPTEAWARVNEIRHDLKLDPMHFDNVLNEGQLFKKNKAYTELRQIYEHRDIENLVNNLPAMVALDMKMDKDGKYK